ncbi:unnamed protein product [Closterium sp. Naga37s-1]|nr:unnamed protein product [Closterium sp. Naga37s-1]
MRNSARFLLVAALLAVAVTAEAATPVDDGLSISTEDVDKALSTLRASPYAKTAPLLEKFFRMVKRVNGTSKATPVTVLQPINPLKVVRNWVRFSAGERRRVARYHMLKGVFTKRKLRNAARFTKFTTYEGGKVTKWSGRLLPSVILKGGSDILPAALVFGNFYVSKNFALHIISSSLTPGDV